MSPARDERRQAVLGLLARWWHNHRESVLARRLARWDARMDRRGE